MIAYGLAAQGLTNHGVPRSLLKLALLVDLLETRLVGPLALLNPAFGLARRHGAAAGRRGQAGGALRGRPGR
ncbi:MAG TPA: hypothetical protein PKD53_15285 [Chloroflexaceae bacterium]|nr:hypothetical protein [Chloroflexaceae bacterium]